MTLLAAQGGDQHQVESQPTAGAAPQLYRERVRHGDGATQYGFVKSQALI